MKMSRTTAITAMGVVVLLLAGCSGPGGANPGSSAAAMTKCLTDTAGAVSSASQPASTTITPSTGFAANAIIGVSLPDDQSMKWIEAKPMFNKTLTAAGYRPIVQVAINGVSDQQNQIDALVKQGISVLVVGPIDSSALGSQLDAAKAAGITVIAYDRQLIDTGSVDMYVSYDNFLAGQLQGQALIQGMLMTQGPPPYNIELMAGAPDDVASTPLFAGAMSVLQPGIECGALVIRSRQTSQNQVSTPGWLPANAKKRVDAILANYYTSDTLNGILVPTDAMARAALESLSDAEKTDQRTVITGQDSETESIPLVMAGSQYMTIYRDTQGLVDEVTTIIGLLQQGQPVPVSDTTIYNNGNKIVPAVLLTPQAVTASNAAEVYANDASRIGCTQDPPANCQQ